MLVKWCGPVGLRLPDALTGARRTRVLQEVSVLARLTAVDFQLGADPGIEVHYPLSWKERDRIIEVLPSESPAARRRMRSARCFFVIEADPSTGCLTRAHIVIPDALEEPEYQHCVAEEFSQILGIPYDIDAGTASLFSRSGLAPERTDLDDLFLRVLYDPGLLPGSERPALEALVPGLIRKHR